MSVLENIIGDLLLRHNCVIIPSFGGFVAKPVSAHIDYNKGTMTPPSKSILFNKQLINNDGLLINELAQRESVSYDEAEQTLSLIVNEWNSRLRSGSRIEIERVGFLYIDEENKICFEQDRFSNLLLESFGLGTVNFVTEKEVLTELPEVEKKVVPVEETKIVALNPEPVLDRGEVIEINEKEDVVEHPAIEQVRKKSNVWKYVAAACMLPVLFYSIWIPVRTDVLESGVISINDFNPFYHTSSGSYSNKSLKVKPEEKEEMPALQEEVENLEGDFYTYRIDGSNFISVKLKEETVEDNATGVEGPVQSFNPEAMNFIVGCFSNQENATNLVVKLKSEGFNARIVDVHNGLHRVSAGEGLSVESINGVKNTAQSAGYKGWILK